jgi:hypothetical protein
MDPVELIVAALAAGAAGGAENVASTAVKDAYRELNSSYPRGLPGKRRPRSPWPSMRPIPRQGEFRSWRR